MSFYFVYRVSTYNLVAEAFKVLPFSQTKRYIFLNNFSNRPDLMPYRSNKGSHIMNATNEYGTNYYPNQNRPPKNSVVAKIYLVYLVNFYTFIFFIEYIISNYSLLLPNTSFLSITINRFFNRQKGPLRKVLMIQYSPKRPTILFRHPFLYKP